ncbi:PAS domain S-box protein [Mongoliibacter ruber]|uniref:histidine kinase n=1 Tax=Mongoliibacter ruber TaxID=1750599 RepID=A0A2T0WVS4_9BACT|nr:PAS domain S-box protein [Mongoliibacter ruber]PRY90694.1 PAS domain S-box-containing protein [Mongoliibacter ruber]
MKNTQFSNLILDQSKDLVWAVDKNLDLVYANRAYSNLMEEVTGVKKELNTPILVEGFGEGYIEKWKAYYQKALSGEHFEIEEHFYNPETQEIQYGHIAFSPIRDKEGEILTVACRNTDITPVIRQKDHASRLMDASLDVFCTIDEEGNFVFVSSVSANHWGYHPEELIGKSYRDLIVEEDLEKTDLVDAEILAGKEFKSFSNRFRKKNGDIAYNLWSARWDNETKLMYCVARDGKEKIEEESEKELLSQISQSFNNDKELIPSGNHLCENLYAYGKFDLIELWCPSMEGTKINLIGKSDHNQDFYEFEPSETSFQKDKGLPGKVWNKVKQLLWDEKQINKNFIRKKGASHLGLKAILGIPLSFNDELVGVLLIGTKREPEYLEKHSPVLSRLEKFIGSEINRKRLEDNLKHLYKAIPDILCIADFYGRFLKINPAGCELLGYKEKEILFHTFEDFVHPEDKHVSTREVKKLETGANTFQFENRYITKDGKIIWLSWSCNSSVQEGLIYASAKDITAMVQLRELNTQAGTLAKIGSWEIDLEKNTVFWSKIVHQLHETDPNTFTPDIQAGINFYREDCRALVQNSIEKSTSTGKGFDFEAVIITKKLKERWVRAIGNVEIFKGKTKRIYGSFQDITDRKESELRLQSFANNLPGVAFQYYIYPNGSDDLKYVTNGAEKVWGFDEESVMEENSLVWKQVELGGELDFVKKSIMKSVETKSEWKAQWRYIMPNNELRIHAGYGTPTILPDKSIVFNSLILDITQEYRSEELLEQASEMAKIGSWELNLADQTNDRMYWSPMTREILEVDDDYNPSLTGGFEFYSGEDKEKIQKEVAQLIETGQEFDLELLIITQDGKEKWIRCIGKSEWVKGACTKIYGSYQDIHVAKSNELRLKEILESISDAFYAVDANWNFTYFNREAEQLLKKSADEVLGENIWGIFSPAKGTVLEKIYRRVAESGQSENFEYHYPGNGCWYEISTYPSSGGISSYFKNIDERKESAKELEKAYKEKNEILESIGDAFFAVDEDWIITYWNKQSEIIMGKNKESVLGENLWELYPDAVDTDFYVQYHRAMESGEMVNFEEYYPTLNIWVEVTVYPSENGLSIYFKDITLRKAADIRLLKANERFELVTKATKDAIWDWDIENDNFYRSNNIHKILGIGASTELKKNQFWKDAFHPEDLEKIKESIQRELNDPQSERWEMEYRVLNDNNEELSIIDRGIIVRNKNGKAARMVGAMTDLTKQKRLEKELFQLNESLKNYAKELERSNEELEQFAFITSHDLQEPLRMISSFMDQLKRKYAEQLDDKALQYIHFATDGAKRMKQIILDLLLYSRANKPSEHLEEINLNEILADYTQLRSRVIVEKNASIKFDKLPVLNTYRAPITQIVHCLLDNALKYVKENIPPCIEIYVKEKETVWEFAVKDNGIGIDEKFYDKIFIIFQRLHNRNEHDGTGIGLSIAKRGVEFLGGEIWLESTVDKGSTFYFTIAKNQ